VADGVDAAVHPHKAPTAVAPRNSLHREAEIQKLWSCDDTVLCRGKLGDS
jgi:hypothetical protein